MITKANNLKSYYVKGVREFVSNGIYTYYIFIKERYDIDDDNISTMIKYQTNTQVKALKNYNKIYIKNIISCGIVESKSKEKILQVEVNNIKIDTTSITAEDYEPLIDTSPYTFYSPLQ